MVSNTPCSARRPSGVVNLLANRLASCYGFVLIIGRELRLEFCPGALQQAHPPPKPTAFVSSLLFPSSNASRSHLFFFFFRSRSKSKHVPRPESHVPWLVPPEACAVLMLWLPAAVCPSWLVGPRPDGRVVCIRPALQRSVGHQHIRALLSTPPDIPVFFSVQYSYS